MGMFYYLHQEFQGWFVNHEEDGYLFISPLRGPFDGIFVNGRLARRQLHLVKGSPPGHDEVRRDGVWLQFDIDSHVGRDFGVADSGVAVSRLAEGQRDVLQQYHVYYYYFSGEVTQQV